MPCRSGDGLALAIAYVAVGTQAILRFAGLIKISPYVWMDIALGPCPICGCAIIPQRVIQQDSAKLCSCTTSADALKLEGIGVTLITLSWLECPRRHAIRHIDSQGFLL